MKVARDRFKSKANSILKSSPQSIKEFLEDPPECQREENDAFIPQCVDTKMHALPEKEGMVKDYVRLHVHLRQDLADKLFEVVFKRKKNHNSKKSEASQRVIIEEALEMYFASIRIQR